MSAEKTSLIEAVKKMQAVLEAAKKLKHEKEEKSEGAQGGKE